jgi:hypothetical protein
MSKIKEDLSVSNLPLPEGTKHLTGNLFMVPFASIRAPEGNPRLLTESGLANIIDKQLANELRESIKNNTLLNPLVCRWTKDENGNLFPIVEGGDRRYRSLDYLIRRKEIVVDPRNIKVGENGQWHRSMVPASEAYEFVPCQVFFCNNDLEALALAWADNKNRVNLTEGHEIAEVIKLRDVGAKDADIMNILQRDQKWLADTDRLIGSLDHSSLADLIEGRLDRNAAIELAAINDIEIRDKVRIAANESSTETWGRKIYRLQRRITQVVEENEKAKGDLVFSETSEEKQEAQERIDQTEAQSRAIARQRDETRPVTTSRAVIDASNQIAGTRPRPVGKRGPKGGPRRMREIKIKEGRDLFVELLKNNGEAPDGSFTASVESLKLLIKVINDNILNNNPDWAATIRKHYSA